MIDCQGLLAIKSNFTLPEPVFPQFPERLNDPGPEDPPEKRKWGVKDVYRTSWGWLLPLCPLASLAGASFTRFLEPIGGSRFGGH
jgi:hypothetical protein